MAVRRLAFGVSDGTVHTLHSLISNYRPSLATFRFLPFVSREVFKDRASLAKRVWWYSLRFSAE